MGLINRFILLCLINLLFFYFAFCLTLFSANNVGGRVILSHLFSLLIVQKQPLEFLQKHLYIFVQAINTQNMRESTEKQFHCEIRMKECVCSLMNLFGQTLEIFIHKI